MASSKAPAPGLIVPGPGGPAPAPPHPSVFGKPVTDDTVRLVFPNLTTITARDRARAALMHINADGKSVAVTSFVHSLKKEYGDGTSTLGTIYNATGGDLTFILSHTWEGSNFRFTYPHLIKNGQWAGFLHVRGRLAGPSKEAIMYRGTNNDGLSRNWLLAWNTTRMKRPNRVYTDITEGVGPVDWNTVDTAMNQHRNNVTLIALGCHSDVSIGMGSSPGFVGIMSLDGLGEFIAKANDVSVISRSLDSKYDDVVQGEDNDDDDDDADNATPAPK